MILCLPSPALWAGDTMKRVSRLLVSAGGELAFQKAAQVQMHIDEKLATRLQTVWQMKMLL